MGNLKQNILENKNVESYLDLLKTTLSSYVLKEIANDGTVLKLKVKDNYFLKNDVWDIQQIGRLTNFNKQYESYKGKNNFIKFDFENSLISLELKFVFYHKLFNDEWSLNSVFSGMSTNLNRFNRFINNKYPHIDSLLDLDMRTADKEWIFWLNEQGIKTETIRRDVIYFGNRQKTAIASFFPTIYEKLFNLTDVREEFEKDKWDVRNLLDKYDVSYNYSDNHYYLDYSKIKNLNYRNHFKKYIQMRLLGSKKLSWSSAYCYIYPLTGFFNFISEIEPEWNNLNNLSRVHIEKYLVTINKESKIKSRNPKFFVFEKITKIYTFLKDIQQFEYQIAPRIITSKLLLSEDYPILDKKSIDTIDCIPDYVLDQLFENINELHPDIQPIIWISFKTGMRISDTLGLTQDSLVRLNGKYSIQTDIEKTFVKGHRIPIDEHLANIIAVLIHKSKELSNDDNNPNRFLFVRYRGSRKGRPFFQGWVSNKLNELSIKKNIKDELGNIFHFKTHQFRHTYAVKMLNNGADILTVQELLAHSSPEMTIRYARLLDDTKRIAFENVIKQGVFTFDLNGEIHKISEEDTIPENIIDMMWRDEKLNSLDNPYGTCRARVNGNCPLAVDPPCLTANDGKPCFDLAVGMSSFDIKKYELLIDTTSKWIQTSKEYGREDMVKANEKNLERYQSIYETIKNGNIIFGRIDRVKKQLEKIKKKEVLHV